MNRRAKRELPKLAVGLLRVPPEKFQINFWGNSDDATSVRTVHNSCRFAGCAIGWLPKLVPDTKLVVARKRPTCQGGRINFLPEFGNLRHWEAVNGYYGITPRESRWLFSPEAYSTEVATPAAAVASRIALFLANNGKIPRVLAPKEATNG